MSGSWDSESGQPPGPHQAPASKPSNAFGVASLVIGLVALVASVTVVGGVMLGILAAMLGLIARAQVKHGQASNGDVAITGVVLGVLAIVASMIVAIFWVVPKMSSTSSETRITNIASSSALVVAALQAPARGQQLELGVSGHQAFGGVENVDDVAAVTGHHGHSDARPAVQIARTGLGGGHTELALQLGDYRTDHRSLLFE
jgi:hypothetical protein